MVKQELLATAINLAVMFHSGQFDKGGAPYILHCLAVMNGVQGDEELKAIAVLHDVVEDTACTCAMLREHGMTERVIEGVYLLTKQPCDTPETYLSGLTSSRDAMTVKLADLRHNMDPARLKGVRDKDVARMGKYMRMHREISEALAGSA